MPFIAYKNIEIHYTSLGKGSVVVLLHGFLESSTMWQEIAPVLAQKHRVITIDLLGHGKTANLAYVHTMKMQAIMVRAVLAKLKINKYSLIGHSMGGYIALALAKLNPEVISQLVLMNSTSLVDSPERLLNRDRAIKMIKQNKETFIKMAIPNLFAVESMQKYKSAILALKDEALAMSTQGIIAALEGMKVRANTVEILQKATFPILFIAGTKDTVLNYEDLVLETANTKVEFRSLDTGHMSHITNTTELLTLLQDFLN